jgi:hypothetical protein
MGKFERVFNWVVVVTGTLAILACALTGDWRALFTVSAGAGYCLAITDLWRSRQPPAHDRGSARSATPS